MSAPATASRRTPLLGRVVFAGLVVATVLAFFISQHLKVTTPFISGVQGPHPATISPVAGPRTCRSTTVSFYVLHQADSVNVYVLNQPGLTVRTLARAVYMRKPRAPTAQGFDAVTKKFTWDGRDNSGRPVAAGTYFFFVDLLNQQKQIQLASVKVTHSTTCQG